MCMSDTTPEIEVKIRELIQAKTPSERAEMGCSMFETSKQLIIRFIKEEHPGISDAELKKQLFLKLYGDEFGPEQIVKIFEAFAKLICPLKSPF